jgi:hypothetical protein
MDICIYIYVPVYLSTIKAICLDRIYICGYRVFCIVYPCGLLLIDLVASHTHNLATLSLTVRPIVIVISYNNYYY